MSSTSSRGPRPTGRHSCSNACVKTCLTVALLHIAVQHSARSSRPAAFAAGAARGPSRPAGSAPFAGKAFKEGRGSVGKVAARGVRDKIASLFGFGPNAEKQARESLAELAAAAEKAVAAQVAAMRAGQREVFAAKSELAEAMDGVHQAKRRATSMAEGSWEDSDAGWQSSLAGLTSSVERSGRAVEEAAQKLKGVGSSLLSTCEAAEAAASQRASEAEALAAKLDDKLVALLEEERQAAALPIAQGRMTLRTWVLSKAAAKDALRLSKENAEFSFDAKAFASELEKVRQQKLKEKKKPKEAKAAGGEAKKEKKKEQKQAKEAKKEQKQEPEKAKEPEEAEGDSPLGLILAAVVAGAALAFFAAGGKVSVQSGSAPTVTMPSITVPSVTMPSMPKVSLPSMPKVSVPSLPKVSLPSAPKAETPKAEAPQASVDRESLKALVQDLK